MVEVPFAFVIEQVKVLLDNAARPSGALAFGVPPMLLGIPGDNTYANYQEANRAFWRLTLLPLVDKVLAGLSRWLGADQRRPAALVADRDAITALAPEREALYARLGAASFLTPNEKRASVGLGPVEGGDALPPAAPVPPAGGGGRPGPFDLGLAGTRPAEAKQDEAEARPDLDAVFVKIWRTVGDEKVRASHRAADGQIRLEDEPFEVGDAKLAAPRDPEGPPEETINCRCQMDVVPVTALEGEERRRAEKQIRQKECNEIQAQIENLELGKREFLSQIFGIQDELSRLAQEHKRRLEQDGARRNAQRLDAVVSILRAIGRNAPTGRVIEVIRSSVTFLIELAKETSEFNEIVETSIELRRNMDFLVEQFDNLDAAQKKLRERARALSCALIF